MNQLNPSVPFLLDHQLAALSDRVHSTLAHKALANPAVVIVDRINLSHPTTPRLADIPTPLIAQQWNAHRTLYKTSQDPVYSEFQRVVDWPIVTAQKPSGVIAVALGFPKFATFVDGDGFVGYIENVHPYARVSNLRFRVTSLLQELYTMHGIPYDSNQPHSIGRHPEDAPLVSLVQAIDDFRARLRERMHNVTLSVLKNYKVVVLKNEQTHHASAFQTSKLDRKLRLQITDSGFVEFIDKVEAQRKVIRHHFEGIMSYCPLCKQPMQRDPHDTRLYCPKDGLHIEKAWLAPINLLHWYTRSSHNSPVNPAPPLGLAPTNPNLQPPSSTLGHSKSKDFYPAPAFPRQRSGGGKRLVSPAPGRSSAKAPLGSLFVGYED